MSDATEHSGPVDVLAVLRRIAKTNADFAATADKDGIVRIGESMLSMQAADLSEVSAAVAELIEADKAFDEAIAAYGISSRWSVQANERRRAALANIGAAS